MGINRRGFLQAAALGAGTMAAGCAQREPETDDEVPEAIRALRPMTDGIVPISDDERRQRIDQAQRLMAEHQMDAIFMEGATSCFYYTGMRWGQSERTFGVVIPAVGALAYVCPGFEEDRARELLKPAFGDEVRVWQEEESPYAVIAGIVNDRGVKHHRIGVEERVRFRAGLATLREGMPQDELERNLAAAFRALGLPGYASAQFGKWTALPHGSATPQKLKEGDVVMIDDGAECQGYVSDITRTVVFGKPTARQTEVWNKELEAQTAAFNAVKIGATCESVDAAARAVIEKAGFGPGYKVPGLPHRTGHGMGLDGHEWTNFVKGNTTPIQPGMCFSDEPMISIPGEFGIRLEDDLYIGEDGPHFFTKQSVAIDQPFG